MKRIVKLVVIFLLRILTTSNLQRQAKIIGWDNTLQFWFFQRILRVNSRVPWPVHWSSKVVSPQNIIKKSYRPFPGYMIGQYIQASNGIHIGFGVRIGPGAKIISANHNVLDYDIHDKVDPIVIGDDCWIGANAVVLPGVILGTHIIVAAGVVVTKSCLENDVVLAGVPARIVKKLEPYAGVKGYANEGIDS